MADTETARVRAAAEMLHGLSDLLPATIVQLINPLVYANAGALGDAAYRRFLFWVNTARDVSQRPVRIGHYGRSTYVDGTGPFHVFTEDVLVREHLVPGYAQLDANYISMVARRSRAIDIGFPCVFACHPGTQVWSHWLIDTLPRILLAEQALPGRFRFVVPADITDPDSERFLVRSILESLAAYGISQDRLLRLEPGRLYRFDALFDVIDLNDDGMHPGVLAALRTLKTPPPFRGRYSLTATMRQRGELRDLVNLDEVRQVLSDHGAGVLDPGSAPFLEKIRAFRDSEIIVGDLGSNLATLIYASPGAGIVTVAPNRWRDNYFAQIIQRLGLYHADIRGVPLPRLGDAEGHWAHMIRPEHLREGIAAVAAARADQQSHAPVMVDGRRVARALGPRLLHIDFGAGGNAAAYRRGEFSEPEGARTWSLGPACAVVVPGFGGQAGADSWIEIKGEGFIAKPHLLSRALGVVVNGVELAAFDIDELTHVQVFAPLDVLRRSADLVIEFRHAVCPSPRSMGQSDDDRPLGFMFEYVALRAMAAH